MREKSGAYIGIFVLAVIGLIGQRDTALLKEDDIAIGIARVVIDKKLPEAFDATAFKASQRDGKRLFAPIGRLRNLFQECRERSHPDRFDSFFIHKAGVKVAYFPGSRTSRGTMGAFDNVLDGFFGFFRENRESAVARFVGGDF